jgi:hypothetical protein
VVVARDRSLLALKMEAVRTSETSVDFYKTTLRYNPEDRHLRTHRCDNLKSYLFLSSTYEKESRNKHAHSI